MICKLYLCIAVLLTVLEVMLGHPVVQTRDMTYGRPVLVEDDQLVSPEDLSYSEQAFLSQGSAGFGYPSIITGDLSRDINGVQELFVQTSFCVHPNKDTYAALEQLESLRTAGFVPGQALKEVLLEKPLMNPLSRFLGARKQYHKRGSNTECFWKYCV